jgi:hypothetical protein
MAKAVSCPALAADALVHAQVSACGYVVDKVTLGYILL